jgi:uncharacterized membrane protein YeaQ/YmgE (transglycosylase-associated protein family)
MDPATTATAVASAPAAAPALDPSMVQSAEHWANVVLTWVGFGTIVGLLAKAIMPGRDPGGALATLLMGVAGTVIGCGTVSYFMPATPITPISVVGFACGTGGAFVILLFYRLLGGYVYGEGGGVVVTTTRRRRRRPEEHVETHPEQGSFEP